MNKIILVAHLERMCIKCKKTLSLRVHEYKPASTFEEIDEQIGQFNLPVTLLECPSCGAVGHPEELVLYDISSEKLKEVIRQKIGTPGFPVVGGENLPYGVTISPEEQAEYERGLAKIQDYYHQHKEDFWNQYCAYALEKWLLMLKEINVNEFSRAYEELGLPLLPATANVAAWRRDAEKKFKTREQKIISWRAFNRYLVEQEFVWVPIDTWPMQEWVRKYGRERVLYLTLHLPLPEEMERWRTEKLGQVIKKRTGESGVLFERIGQLGRELEKQKKRAAQLGQTVLELRQENGLLQEELARAQKELLRKPAVIDRQADDIRKIRQLKGLIAELRAEVDRLSSLLPPEEKEKTEEEIILPETQAQTEEITVDLSILSGKTILIVGWPNETIEADYRVVWHDGDRVDVKLQALTREADIFVFLTRFGSHSVMWWLKETAIDNGKPVYFMKARNLQRILRDVAIDVSSQKP